MRRSSLQFAHGLMAGLALGGVIVLTTVAARRALSHYKMRSQRSDRAFIDGVREPEEAALSVRPQQEANSALEPLESEAVDVVNQSQRW